METLKDLASVTDEHGVAMTAYIDLDPSDSATPKERESHEHAVLDELRRYHPGDASHEAKLRFEATLARVSARLADLDLGAGRHRGAAVYAWGEDGIEAEGFRERVEDHSVVGRRLSLTTAATRASRGDDVLILIASREAGHLYRYRRGELETTFDDSESVQEIDIDNHVHIHRVVEHLVKLHDRIGRPPVAIVADSTLQPVIAERLTPTVAEVAIRVERNEANWRTEDILTEGEHALAERDRARQAELLGHWQTQSGRDEGHQNRAEELLAAISDGRVETLLLAQGADIVVFSCPTCGRLYPEAGTCPLDGAWLEADQRTDAAVAKVLENSGAVWELLDDDDSTLAQWDGAGAVLRY